MSRAAFTLVELLLIMALLVVVLAVAAPMLSSSMRGHGLNGEAVRFVALTEFARSEAISQGVPMVLHGDELGRTQHGNNNSYCQDSDVSWLDWKAAGKESDLQTFTSKMIAFRRAHPVFRRRRFFEGRPTSRESEVHDQIHDIAWFTPMGREMTEQDWEVQFGRAIAVYLNGTGIAERDEYGEPVVDDSFLLCFNAHYEDIEFTVPADEYAREWAVVVDTTDGTVVVGSTTRPDGDPADGYGAEPIELADAHTVMANDTITVTSRSLLVLQRLP